MLGVADWVPQILLPNLTEETNSIFRGKIVCKVRKNMLPFHPLYYLSPIVTQAIVYRFVHCSVTCMHGDIQWRGWCIRKVTYDILLDALEALDAMGTSLLLGTLLAGALGTSLLLGTLLAGALGTSLLLGTLLAGRLDALGTSLLLGRSAGRLSFSGHSVGMLQESQRQRRRQSRELLWLPFFLWICFLQGDLHLSATQPDWCGWWLKKLLYTRSHPSFVNPRSSSANNFMACRFPEKYL